MKVERRPGCYDKPRECTGYLAKNGVSSDGRFKFIWIAHTMSVKCRQMDNLPECEGCMAEKDHEYIERMKSL